MSIGKLGRRAIAIIRTDGVGDAILFEPSLRSLARRFDGYEIDLWSPSGVGAMFETHPAVAQIIRIPRGYKQGNATVFWSLTWRAKLGFNLGRFSYATAVYIPHDPEPLGAWLLAQMRANEKWLNAGSTLNQFDWQRDWAQRFATQILQPRPAGGHELQRNAYLAEHWEASIESERPDLALSPRALTYASVHAGAARHAVRRTRAEALVGVIPAGSSAINQYPLEKWIDTISRIWEHHQMLPALLGGPADAELIAQISRRLTADGIPHHVFPTDCDIAVSAAVVSRLDAVLSVDTGLAHAAVSFDLPTVVLVTGGMPGRFWPWPMATRSIALTKPMPCAGCNYICTQPGALCLTDLSPEWIVDALIRAMKSKSILPQTQRAKEYRHAG